MKETVNRDLLKKFREDRGMTQKELGALLGISKNHISQWEIGFYSPSEKYRNKLVKIFGYGILEYKNVSDLSIPKLTEDEFKSEEKEAMKEIINPEVLKKLEIGYKQIQALAAIWRWCY